MASSGAGGLDEQLDRLEALFLEEDLEGLKRELRQACRRFPGELALKEWEATLAAGEERFGDALRILDAMLAEDPEWFWAARERCAVLMELGQTGVALAALDQLLARGLGPADAAEEASLHFDRALCLDRLGRIDEAEREFAAAARLAPAEWPVPPRLKPVEFEALVAAALDAIPPRFLPYLRQVAVVVRDYPAAEHPDPFLLGLYLGIPRTERTQESKDALDTIFIYKRNHELLNLSAAELKEEVRKTVIHEIGHHFGLSEEEMGEYA